MGDLRESMHMFFLEEDEHGLFNSYLNKVLMTNGLSISSKKLKILLKFYSKEKKLLRKSSESILNIYRMISPTTRTISGLPYNEVAILKIIYLKFYSVVL